MDFKQTLFCIKDSKDFENLAMEVFSFQYENNSVYRQWCDLTAGKVTSFGDIPFLPISFFKTHDITCRSDTEPEDYFLSSGTSYGKQSRHNVFDKNFYLKNSEHCFSQFYDCPFDYSYIFLLPNYLSQQHSSLICMADNFAKKSKYPSRFFANNISDAADFLLKNESNNIPTILFGVSYALLDLIEYKHFNLKNTVVFETGGMKGRRKEITKKELHEKLKEGFNVDNISSEYGMCELFSQSYSKQNGIFYPPEQVKIFIKQVNDPKSNNLTEKNGVINIIDLANIDTCAFIRTEDLGIMHADGGFEILGRVENSAVRGCNLMYDSL